MGFHKDYYFNDRDLNTLRKLYYKFNELIYLCNNFDINSVNNFLINIIENNDFIIKDDKNGVMSNKYSDIRDSDKLSGDIIASDEYNNMINYMNYNFRIIYEKYNKYLTKIENFDKKYINYIKETKDDVDTIQKIKHEYKIVISNLEELQLRFSELINKNIIADTINGIKIDVVLITNNSITYNIIGYWTFKKFLYKNLHIIDKDTYEITNSDINEFKNNFYKIYSKVHQDFLKKYKNGYADQFNEKIITTLKNTIAEYRRVSKIAEEEAEKEVKRIAEKKKEEEETKNNELDDKTQKAITKAKDAELMAQTAEKKYNDQQSIVNSLRKSIAKLEKPDIIIPDDKKLDDINKDNKAGADAGADLTAASGASGTSAASGASGASAVSVSTPASATAASTASVSTPASGATAASGTSGTSGTSGSSGATAASATPGSSGATVASATTSASATAATTTDPMSRVSYLYLLTQKSITGLEKGNIPDRIWIIILLNEGWKGKDNDKFNTDKFNWKDIINKWQNKSKEKEDTINETKNRDYWDNAAKGYIKVGSSWFQIKPIAELQEILLIGEIPSDWTGYKSKANLEKARKDSWMALYLNRYQQNILENAAQQYFKDHHGATDMMKYGYPAVVDEKDLNIQKYGDKYVSVQGDIVDEFIKTDNYRKSILQSYKFASSGPYYYLQDKYDKGEMLGNIETERRRYYLTNNQMKFYDDYYDYYQNRANLNEEDANIIKNKTLFVLPQPIDGDIEEFKRVDRFLSAIYNDLLSYRNTDKKDRNIIILPKSDERIYLKYISFFDEHYKDPILKVEENLIFIGKRYELKTKTDLDIYRETL